MKVKNLKSYIESNLGMTKDDKYYSESFANLTLDYYGMKGEFSKADINYLEENGYNESDFIED